MQLCDERIPCNIHEIIERIKGKIAFLKAENRYLRSLLELAFQENESYEATEEINQEKEFREDDCLEEIQYLEDSLDETQGLLNENIQQVNNEDHFEDNPDQEKQLQMSKAEEPMSKPPKAKIKWYSPKSFANLANEGFLSVVRTTGKAVGLVQFGSVRGLSKIEQTLFSQKKEQEISSPPKAMNSETEIKPTMKTTAFPQSPGNARAANPTIKTNEEMSPKEVVSKVAMKIQENEETIEKKPVPFENESVLMTEDKPVHKEIFQERA